MFRRIHWFIKFVLLLMVILFAWIILTEIVPRLLPEEDFSNTEVYGIQIRAERWSGTIHVTGDLITPHGAPITVMPGTRIIVSHGSDRLNLDFIPWHQRVGLNKGKTFFGVQNGEYFWDESHKVHLYFSKLIAIGTKQQPITITSDAPTDTPSPYDISSITVGQGVISNVNASNYRKLEVGDKVVVRDSYFNNGVECLICIGNSDPSIINNHFKKALREDIWVGGGSPRITDNYFSSDSPAGIRFDPEGFGEPIISHNDFEMAFKEAIDDLSGDEAKGGEISFNIFPGNSVIQIPCDTKLKIIQNSILGMVTFPKGGCMAKLTLGPNYWGIKDQTRIINERVIRQGQDVTVEIPTILDTAPVGVGPR